MGDAKREREEPIPPTKNKDGEPVFEISAKRRITVRKYGGKPLVDIREFYGEEEDLKPGKKGISLTVGQWEQLLEHREAIDEALKELAAKK